MTIQRKYSLPNCTLLLEGLSDSTTSVQSTEVRPLISMLVNAECHLTAIEQPLMGGRDFFESLASAVSGYAQEFLSKVHHPEAHKKEPGLVQLQKVDDKRHRLIVNPGMSDQAADVGSSSVQAPIQIDLTTVQLFDLVEAIDQFFADSQTLPDLSLSLRPVSKRYAGSSQLIATQAVPAAIGVSGLAITAIALFSVPIPPIRRTPQPSLPQNSSLTTPNTSRSHVSPAPRPTNTGLDLAAAPEITNASQLHALNRKLYNQLNQAWKTRSKLPQDLVYRVGVDAQGAIMGYKGVNSVATSDYIEQTPLHNLLQNPVAGGTATQERLAQFKVVFTKKEVLQVSPWRGYRK